MNNEECELKKHEIIIAMLEGYKTYICAALIIVAGVLYMLKLLDDSTLLVVVTLLTGGGLASARSATKKLE